MFSKHQLQKKKINSLKFALDLCPAEPVYPAFANSVDKDILEAN